MSAVEVLTGVNVPDHLVDVPLDSWRARPAGLQRCAHPATSHGWPGDDDVRLLCPPCSRRALATPVADLEAGLVSCAAVGCDQPASVIVQLPVRRHRRAGAPEVVIVGFWCEACSEPTSDYEEAQ